MIAFMRLMFCAFVLWRVVALMCRMLMIWEDFQVRRVIAFMRVVLCVFVPALSMLACVLVVWGLMLIVMLVLVLIVVIIRMVIVMVIVMTILMRPFQIFGMSFIWMPFVWMSFI